MRPLSISTEKLAKWLADVNVLVFLGTLGCQSNESDVHSSLDARLPILLCAPISVLRCSVEVRHAIREFREGGCCFASERHLSARHVGAAKGRSGFRACGFRESGAACAEQPGRTQLPGLGIARTGRNRFGDRSFPCGRETEPRFRASAFASRRFALPGKIPRRSRAAPSNSSATEFR